MTDNRTDASPSLPVANYGPALARAVNWLGNRYLLAQPVNAIRKHRAPAAPASRPVNAQ